MLTDYIDWRRHNKFEMNIHLQYIYDKRCNPVGVILSIEEWEKIQSVCKPDLPELQKTLLEAEMAALEAGKANLIDWEEVKR
jgi:hypothetical protein